MIKKCFDWNTDRWFQCRDDESITDDPIDSAEPRRAAFAEVAMFATIGYILPEYWRLVHLSFRKMEKFRWVSGWWLQVFFGCCKCHTYAVGKIMCICIMYRIVDNNRDHVIIIVIFIVITITMIATITVIYHHTY